MAGVLCVGIATQDYVFSLDAIPARPEKHRARELAVVGGGIAANAAVAVARLGGHAMLATRLGDDALARDIVAALEADRVDCTLALRAAARRSPLSAIMVDPAGERLVVNYADPDMPAGVERLPSRLPPGIGAVMADTRWEEGARHAFGLAREAGVPALLDADRAPANAELLRLATHVAFSAQGLRETTGIDDPRGALVAVAAMSPAWLAVTDGPRGVTYSAPDGLAHAPAYRVRAVDTLAAGDVWHGAFALGLAEGMAEADAVDFASAAAAVKCTRFGGRAGAPSRAEVEAMRKQGQGEDA